MNVCNPLINRIKFVVTLCESVTNKALIAWNLE